MVIATEAICKFAEEDCLVAELSKIENERLPTFERTNVEYKDYSSRFRENATDFSKQFAHMYACRLDELRQVLLEKAEAKWGDVSIVKLADLEHQGDKRCVIIGTLYKHQQWKPSILRELSEETAEIINQERDDYCDDKDQPFLEDEMLRIKLVGDRVNIGEIITGVVCAILGQKTDAGTFDMEDWCFPGCPSKSLEHTSSRGKLIIVSGLDLINTAESLAMSLLAEWISGMAGNRFAQQEQSNVVRLVIAGNSVATKTIATNDQDFLTNSTENTESLAQISDAICKLDNWLDEILSHCRVTLMPGQHDPTNCMLPQKPLHRFMLGKSFRYANFKGASNPWVGKISNRLVTGSSGQPIEDIARVCGIKNKLTPLEWLERTLIWRHLCPTAPDTLPSHPYYEKDLFIIKECPDIYFVSNTDIFETKLWKGDDGQIVRLICVPRFSTTKSAVIVDLDTLDTETVSFGTS